MAQDMSETKEILASIKHEMVCRGIRSLSYTYTDFERVLVTHSDVVQLMLCQQMYATLHIIVFQFYRHAWLASVEMLHLNGMHPEFYLMHIKKSNSLERLDKWDPMSEA